MLGLAPYGRRCNLKRGALSPTRESKQIKEMAIGRTDPPPTLQRGGRFPSSAPLPHATLGKGTTTPLGSIGAGSCDTNNDAVLAASRKVCKLCLAYL